MKRTTEQKIAEIEGRLARLRNSRRIEQKRLQGDRRRADAHRKIELGGVVIAAGAGQFDPAELCGWLLAVVAQRRTKPDMAVTMRERGLQHFAERVAVSEGCPGRKP